MPPRRPERVGSRGDGRREAPGPSLPALLSIVVRARRDPLAIFGECWRRYGDLVRLPAPGFRPSYLLMHPEHVRHVLQDQHRNYRKAPFYMEKLAAAVGTGLLTAEGELWRGRRRAMQPAFQRERLGGLGPITAELSGRMLARWEALAARGQRIDLGRGMMQLTLAVAARTLFSADLGDGTDAIGRALGSGLAHAARRMRLHVDAPDWLPLPSHRRYLRATRLLDGLAERWIAERRAAREWPDDLLSLLLAARDEATGRGLTEREIRDEIVTVLAAGHETTYLTLTWTWWLLAHHPEAERRLRGELATVLGGRATGVEDLANLPYSGRVLEEALRLYPAIWSFTRAPLADDEIDGYHIPAGATLYLAPYLTHRRSATRCGATRTDGAA